MDNNTVKTINMDGGYEDNTVLHSFNLKLPNHKLSALIGPNGSGKSTFVKYLIKALKPEDQKLFIENKDINKISQNLNSHFISTVNQVNSLPKNFSVFEIVQMALYNNTKPSNQAVLDSLQLTDSLQLKNELINNLSIGQQQMVLLSRALCQNTPTIVLDEPFNNLDIKHTQLLIKILQNLTKNKNKTVFCIMHDLNLVLSYFDYCFILSKSGELYFQGIPEETITEKNIEVVYNAKVKFLINPETNKKIIVV